MTTNHRATLTLAFVSASLLIAGCSDSTPAAADGTAIKDSAADRLAGAEARVDARASEASVTDGTPPPDRSPDQKLKPDGGPKPDKPITDLPPTKLDGKPAVSWTVAATRPELTMNTTLAVHPTKPKTIAVKLEVLSFMPLLQVLTSDNLAATATTATVKSFTGGMGFSEMGKGFGYDPGNPTRLALLSQLVGVSGPPQDSVLFATSTNGGASFSSTTLQTNPFPPDGIKLVGGASSELFVRAQHVLQSSTTLGTSWTTVFSDSSKCLAHGDFAVSAANHGTFLLCCYATLLRCENKVCAPAQLPAGVTDVHRVEFSADGQRALAAIDSGQVVLSTDGGKTFTPTLKLSAGLLVTRLLFDPRPTSAAIYIYRAGKPELWRSLDGGKVWQDVSPPGTSLRDVGIASDGTAIGLASPGVITLAAP